MYSYHWPWRKERHAEIDEALVGINLSSFLKPARFPTTSSLTPVCPPAHMWAPLWGEARGQTLIERRRWVVEKCLNRINLNDLNSLLPKILELPNRLYIRVCVWGSGSFGGFVVGYSLCRKGPKNSISKVYPSSHLSFLLLLLVAGWGGQQAVVPREVEGAPLIVMPAAVEAALP